MEKIANLSIKIYINKLENRITFKIKTGYYLELLIPGTIKSLGSTKTNITQDKNGENVPYLQITEGSFHVKWTKFPKGSHLTLTEFAEIQSSQLPIKK